MRLYNLTSFDSKILKDFFKTAIKEMGAQPNEYIVHVSYSKHKRVWGCAFLHRMYSVWASGKNIRCHGKYFFRITLPKENVNMLRLAQVTEHEIAHTQGLKHKDMLCSNELIPTWHEKFILQ